MTIEYNTNSITPAKPGEQRRLGIKNKPQNQFDDFMSNLPPGVRPWEIIQGVITSDIATAKDKLVGAGMLMNASLKEEKSPIQVNTAKIEISSIDEKIKYMLKTQEELEAEMKAEDAKADGETS